MLVAVVLQPGVGVPIGQAAPQALGDPVPLYDQLVGIVPTNIVEALAKGDMLALIFVAILTGVGTVLSGEAGKPFAALLQSLSSVLLRIVGLVMEATPISVRSEERRVGKECVSKCRYRWHPYHQQKKPVKHQQRQTTT